MWFCKKDKKFLAPPEITGWGINLIFSNLSFCQRVSCEGKCAHAHVQCAGIRVRAKSIMKSVCDVCACGLFSGMPLSQQLHQAWDLRLHFCTLFGTKQQKNALFCLKNYSRMSLSCFRASFPALVCPFLF